MKEFWRDSKNQIVIDIAEYLKQKTETQVSHYKRLAATSALGKFIRSKNREGNDNLKKMNDDIFSLLLRLLKDRRRGIKSNTCSSLADPDAIGTKFDEQLSRTIDALTSVAAHDIDGLVRKRAERILLSVVIETIKDWVNQPPEIPIKIREKLKLIRETKEVSYISLGEEKVVDYEKALETIRSSSSPCS